MWDYNEEVIFKIIFFVSIQMVCGIVLTGLPYVLMKNGRRCDVTFFHLYVSFGIYGSLLPPVRTFLLQNLRETWIWEIYSKRSQFKDGIVLGNWEKRIG